MKAIRIYGPRDARYEEMPEPGPGPGDVLVRVKAAGICGTDLEMFEGTAPFMLNGKTELPVIPGHEWSGEIVSLGPGVVGFDIGDPVTGECSIGCGSCTPCMQGHYHLCRARTETGILGKDGGFAEYISFPAKYLHSVPGIPFDELALTEPTAIALQAVKTAAICPADTVIVMGPGPIGLLAVQCAKAYGAGKVILTGTRDDRLAVGARLGADLTVNIKKQPLRNTGMDITAGGADAIIEAAGVPSVWPHIECLAAPRARIVMTGIFGGRPCPVNFDPIVLNNISITGCVGSPNVWPEAMDLIRKRKVMVKPLITHRLPLRDFTDAVGIAAGRKENAIKVLLSPETGK